MFQHYLIKAIEFLKYGCEKTDCSDCPCSAKSEVCQIMNNIPADWNVDEIKKNIDKKIPKIMSGGE
jgi:hypothetical protein